jgi:hypothetical protein
MVNRCLDTLRVFDKLVRNYYTCREIMDGENACESCTVNIKC